MKGPQSDLERLREQVTALTRDNELLAERAETLLLLNRARIAFERAPTFAAAVEELAEVASALGGLTTTCVARVDGEEQVGMRSHCGGNADGCPVLAELLSRFGEGDRPTTLTEAGVLQRCSLQPRGGVVIPFSRPALGRGVLLFGSDRSELDVGRLGELGELCVDLMEMRAAHDAMRESKARLEAEVERRTAQLAKERRRLEATFEGAGDGIVETAVDGTILRCNPAFARMLGYEVKELLGRKWMTLTHPEDAPDNVAAAAGIRERDDGVVELDKRYQHRDGRPVPARVRVTWLPGEGNTQPYYVTVVHDRTERVRAQRALRRLEHAIAQSQDAVVLTDATGRIEFVNRAFEVTTGYEASEVLGKTPRVLKSGEQDENFYRDLWQTISAGRTWQGRFVNRRKDGSLYVEESTISPVLNEGGEIDGYVAVKRDVSERLDLEERLRQSQKLEAIGQLAGGVAHDFNNLLMPVLIDGELLADDMGADDPRRELVTEIVEAGERAQRLTRQLLAFGRKQVLEVREIDLGEVVRDFSDVLRRVLREDVRLTLQIPEERVCVRADAGQLEQVLMNLAVNAQDAMPEGGRLSIRVGVDAPAPSGGEEPSAQGVDRWACIELEDSGRGMDAETRSRALEPFFTTKARGKGTGLGLATCHGIARQHGGDLSVESEPGVGTKVVVTLPSLGAEGHRADRSRRRRSSRPRSVPLMGRTIWLVDDDEAVRRSTARLLRAAGASVHTFGSADDVLGADPMPLAPDVLVTDVILPGLDGRRMHTALEERLGALPVVYVSGYPDEVLGPRGVLAEGVHFVQKPFARDALLKQIERSLAGPEPAVAR